MADKNQGLSNQSYNGDQDRNRYNQENDYNSNRDEYGNTAYGNFNQNRGMRSDYGNTSFESGRGMEGQGGYGSRYGSSNQGDYNRVNYMPDNDENRGYGNRDYENNRYGSSGNYGYSGGNREDYNYNDRNRMSNYGNASYGNRYRNEGDWNQRQGNWDYNDQGNWGNNDQQNWRRGNTGMGGSDLQNWNDVQNWRNVDYMRGDYNRGSGGYSTRRTSGRDHDRDYSRNRYGGDTRNYGNANQGGYNRDWWDRTKDEVSSWFGDDDAERRRDRDRMTENSHRGRGPKDYKRSEDRIREDVCDRLTDDDRVDASNIQVQVRGDEVILSGNVYSREEKRRAEDLVESISGVHNVENRLRVGHASENMSNDYTGNTSRTGGIGSESGTMNEIIRDTSNKDKNK